MEETEVICSKNQEDMFMNQRGRELTKRMVSLIIPSFDQSDWMVGRTIR